MLFTVLNLLQLGSGILLFTGLSLKKYLPFIYKAKDWEYKQEYRLLISDQKELSKDKESRIITIPDNYITEINLGLSTSDPDKTEIIEIVKQKNIKVYQIKKVPFEFNLKRSQIK